MAQSILIYAGIYPESGIGNFSRMVSLANFFKSKNPNIKLDFLIKNKTLTNKSKGPNFNFNTIDMRFKGAKYDIALFDSKYDEEVLGLLRTVAYKCIGFDFFKYDTTSIDVLINLFNHYSSKQNLFEGNIYQGVKYAIIRDSILTNRSLLQQKNKQKEKKTSILVTFGGEDPRGNTLKILKKLEGADVNITVLVGKLNLNGGVIFEKYQNKFSVFSHVENIESFYKTCDFIICGGGTTMLESIYLGKPVLPIAQNNLEESFINYIHSHVPLLRFHNLELIPERINKQNNLSSWSETYKTFIDGQGKSRICQIIFK